MWHCCVSVYTITDYMKGNTDGHLSTQAYGVQHYSTQCYSLPLQARCTNYKALINDALLIRYSHTTTAILSLCQLHKILRIYTTVTFVFFHNLRKSCQLRQRYQLNILVVTRKTRSSINYLITLCKGIANKRTIVGA